MAVEGAVTFREYSNLENGIIVNNINLLFKSVNW
jgi:hypothetical protein